MTKNDPPARASSRRPPLVERASALGMFVGMVVAFLYTPQWLLTGPIGPGRSGRVWLAVGWVAVVFVGVVLAARRATDTGRS